MTSRYVTAARLRDLDARLTDRDLAVLERVSALKFLTGAQLTRLHFVNGSDNPAAQARAARRALLRLVRLDVLARLPRVVGGERAGSAGFVYHLGLAGQRLAALHGWQPERRGRRSHSPGTLFVAHALRVAELHRLLIEADRSRRLEVLELVAEPGCWRSLGRTRDQRGMLKPDSYARLGVGQFEDSYFLEVDRGSEGSRALTRQLKTYVAYHDQGQEQAARGVFPKTLWLTPDAKRARVIEDCIVALPRSAQGLFAVVPFKDVLTILTNTSM